MWWPGHLARWRARGVHSPRALAIGGSTRSAGGGTLEVVHYMHTSYVRTRQHVWSRAACLTTLNAGRAEAKRPNGDRVQTHFHDAEEQNCARTTYYVHRVQTRCRKYIGCSMYVLVCSTVGFLS